MHRLSPRIGLLVAVLTCAGSSSAAAQGTAPFITNLSRFALGQAVLNDRRNAINAQVAAALAAQQQRAPAQLPSNPVAPVSLTFEPDRRLSNWTRMTSIDALSHGDPALQRQMELAFANDAVLEQFDHLMSARGYSSHDIADDTAELLLVSWEIATGGKATDVQARGVQAQTRALFLDNPQSRTLTNADRQLMGERIAYQVVISSAAQQEYRRDSDDAQRTQLRQSATEILRQEGVDLQQLHLTDRGFAR